jgi:aldose 1-epimerase
MLTSDTFGTTKTKIPVQRYVLENTSGVRVELLSYGALLHRFITPDGEGRLADILMGAHNLAAYEANTAYFGAMVGRCANRISHGRFSLGGRTYQLATNIGEHHLHGGDQGFDKAVWDVVTTAAAPLPSVTFRHVSPHGDQGYPGTLTVEVTYSLDETNALKIDCRAHTDAHTIVNLTNHAYFNLSGDSTTAIADHLLWIDADRFTPVSQAVIPTGELASVAETPFDFRTPTAIGERIDADHEQIRLGEGYDHNYLLNHPGDLGRPAAWAHHPGSGRLLEVFTTQPGIQLYSGNHITADVLGKNGKANGRRHAFCLETQHFPDAPNHAHFPAITLERGETYHHTTIYKAGNRQLKVKKGMTDTGP